MVTSPGGLLLLLAAQLLPVVDGYYFFLSKDVPRCFIEDVPHDMLVMGNYKVPRDAKDIVVFVVTAPGARDRKHDINGEEIMIHKAVSGEGKFVFTAHDDGEHLICAYVNETHPLYRAQNFKVELKFDIGEHAANYDDMAKSEHLSAIELEVRKLVDIVRDIRSQQQYLREREVSFRDISDSTNSSVMWWSFLQTIVLIGSGAWQVYQLKTIFNAKKWD
uniref:GOLD domain-containing protein n=1 Tax=Lotharella globosa TaxID=91324 RepID=A0A7S4DEC2_9EUKA